VFKSPDALPCAKAPDNMLTRRRIPCSEDAGPGAQVASKNADRRTDAFWMAEPDSRASLYAGEVTTTSN